MPDLSILLTSSDLLIHSLGWALIHSLWQGVLVAALLGLLFRAIPEMSNVLRYHLACVALLGLVLAISLTGVYFASTYHNPTPVLEMPIVTGQTSGITTDVTTASPELTVVVSEPVATGSGIDLATQIEGVLPWAVLIWAIGFVLISCRMFFGWLTVRRLCVRQASPIAAVLQMQVNALCESMRIRQTVRVLESGLAVTPMVVGWLRPVVLLPAATVTGLTPQQLRAVLAHELAHVLRNDYLVNLVQCLIETLLFYHPAVWWISRTIRVERERCCDDIAVGVSGDRIDYAKALLRIAETAPPCHGRLSPAAQGGDFAGRIKRLLDQESHTSSTRSAGGFWAGLTAFVLAVVFVMSAVAQETTPKSPENLVDDLLAGKPVDRETMPVLERTIIDIPYDKFIEGDPAYNIVIRPDDVIKIIDDQPRGFVYIQGDIKRPGAYTLPGQNALTLKQLVVSAGGGASAEAPLFIKLVRRLGPDREETMHFSVDDLFEGFSQDAFLAPNDLVVISKEPGDLDDTANKRRELRESVRTLRDQLTDLKRHTEVTHLSMGEKHPEVVKQREQVKILQDKLAGLQKKLVPDNAQEPLEIIPAPERYMTRPPNELDLVPGVLTNTARPGDMVRVTVQHADRDAQETSFVRVLDAEGRLLLPGIKPVEFVRRPIAELQAKILEQLEAQPDYENLQGIVIGLPSRWSYAVVTTPQTGGAPLALYTIDRPDFRLREALSHYRGGLPENTKMIRVVRHAPVATDP